MHQKLLLGALLAGTFIANIDLAVVNVAAPSIHATLGASGAELQLVVSGYIISYAMLLITGARLGAMHGFGRVFALGVALFTATSAIAGVAPDTTTLIVARVIQGAGGALMVAQVLSGIQLSFSGTDRTKAIGAYAIALSAGAVAGQVLGGVLVSADLFGLAWRPAFLVNIPLGVALLITALRVLPRTRPETRTTIDVGGVVTLSAAVLLVILPLIFGRETGWPVWTWLSLAASVPTFAAFIEVERGVTHSGATPLVRFEALRAAGVRWHLIAAASSAATYFAMLFVLALYLQQGLGRSALYSGLALVSWVAAFGVAGPVLARTSRVQSVTVVGYVTMMLAYLAMVVSLVIGQADNTALLFGLLGVGGLGFGLGRNASIAQITNTADNAYAADLSGIINTASQVAGAAGVAIFGTLYLALAPTGGPATAVPAFAITCSLFALVVLGAAVAAARTSGLRSLIAWPQMPPSASAHSLRSS
jgi:predicted MFS family arabinose efflux permease